MAADRLHLSLSPGARPPTRNGSRPPTPFSLSRGPTADPKWQQTAYTLLSLPGPDRRPEMAADRLPLSLSPGAGPPTRNGSRPPTPFSLSRGRTADPKWQQTAYTFLSLPGPDRRPEMAADRLHLSLSPGAGPPTRNGSRPPTPFS